MMTVYCNKLGLIQLSYCLKANGDLPCKSIIDCWSGRVDILRLLQSIFIEEELQKVFKTKHKSRLELIMEIIERHSSK